jgi:SAM-dependent methyltransferase
MGIDAHGLRFLEYAVRAGGPLRSTLTIGRQSLNVSEKELEHYLGMPTYRECFRSTYVDELLIKEFGATSVESIDASDYEQATYVRDLNLELEPDFPQFETVVDAGALEHIFDVRTSFSNIGRCCRLGGRILHVLPANNFVGHGFYQFSPEFFFSLYSPARGFAETEVYLADLGRSNAWWKVLPPDGISRSIAMSSRETYTLVRTSKVSEVAGTSPVQQSDYVGLWDSSAGNVVSSSIHWRSSFVKLSDHLPEQTRAILVSQLTRPSLMQAMRRLSFGLHSRNVALSRVAVPPPRHRNKGS